MSFMTDFHKEVLANGHSAIDDRADQLNRYYAIVFIIACVIFLTTKNIVGKQIFCFTPQRFTSLQTAYANNYCWSKGTYFSLSSEDPRQKWEKTWDHNGKVKVEVEENLDAEGKVLLFDPISLTKDASPRKNGAPVPARPYRVRARQDVSYYRWFPIMLCGLAMMFYVPHIFWRISSARAGINLSEMIDAGHALASLSLPDNKRQILLANLRCELRRITNKEMKTFVNQLISPMSPLNLKQASFDFKPKASATISNWKPRENIFFWYLGSKILYVLNLVMQVVIFQRILRINVFYHYLRFMSDVMQEKEPELEVFPLLTYCEFPGEPQLHSYLLNFGVLCTLPINIYNEWVFHLLITLYMVLLVLLVITIVRWILKVVFLPRQGYFRRRLLWSRPTESFTEPQLAILSTNFNSDSYFILRLVENNCGAGVAAQILDYMFKVQNECDTHTSI